MTNSMLKHLTLKPVLAACILMVAACSTTEILDVEDPDIINPGAVNSPAGADALYSGAVGEFAFAIVGDNGGTEGQILVSGSFADELINSETFPTRLEYELRAIDLRNTTLTTVFRQLQRARVLLEATVPALKQYSPTPTYRIGEAYALAGLAYVFAGENYCSGVPFSTAFPATVYGTPLTTTEIFTTAIERFDSAMAYLTATDTATVTRLNLARVGKGRALLNRGGPGDYAAAAAAVANVPVGFVYNTTHSLSSNRQRNGIFAFTFQNERFSVADVEGTNGLNYRTAGDPRVLSVRDTAGAGVGFDNITPQWNPVKYPSGVSPTPIANGVEAKLIIAENQMAGNPTAWLDTLNFLRDTTKFTRAQGGVAGLAPLADPGTVPGRIDLMFRERVFWMYLTGHRLGDLRRLMRQYGRTEDVVFPTGLGLKGFYGHDLNLPVPFDEQNNPNFTACLDRNP
jgi:starch-binding outer membrane protein, SusD/RagB family